MVRFIMHPVGRLVVGAVGGALLLLIYGQLMGLTGMTCTIVCKPEVGAPLGAVLGALSFLVLGRE